MSVGARVGGTRSGDEALGLVRGDVEGQAPGTASRMAGGTGGW